MRTRRLTLPLLAALVAVGAAVLAPGTASGRSQVQPVALVGYASEAALERVLERHPATVVRRLPELRVAEVQPDEPIARFAGRVARLPGIRYVERRRPRAPQVEPALRLSPYSFGSFEWQWFATRADAVPEPVLRAAASVTIAVIDTGADLQAPDLASKSPGAYDVRSGAADVTDQIGHGTFVASLAAGSVANGEGIAGFGGDARLLVIRIGVPDGLFTDVDAANAIVYAVQHGARVINLSFGGADTSSTEQAAIDYAASRGVLLVAAAGNDYERGNPVTYPAAALQPPGSNGVGGKGLAVGASGPSGTRAAFSNTGSYLSVAAPGESVLGALSSSATHAGFQAVSLPGSLSGLYGYGSGTSFAAPQVAGAAALVWAANPALGAGEVAQILKETAGGRGTWNPELGYGVIDVAAAVARASGSPQAPPAEPVLAASNVTAIPPATASLRLAASSARGRAPLALRLSARLATDVPAIAAMGRPVSLESWAGRQWKRVGVGTTDASGRAGWRVTLKRGTYRVRVRFVGSSDLRPATSAPVTVKVS
jgi:subtilisin family serine protease